MRTHLVSRKSGSSYRFHFRSIIPKDLISHFEGRKQFQISLYNVSYNETLLLSLTLKNLLDRIFYDIRNGMKSLTLYDVKHILRTEVRKQIQHSHHVHLGTNKWDEEQIKKSLHSVKLKETRLRNRLSEDLKGCEKEIDEKFESILNSLEISTEKNSIIYKQLRMSFIEIYVMRYEWMRNLIQETGRDDDDFRREVDKKLRMDLFPELQKQSSSEKIVHEKEIDTLQTTELPVFSSPTKGIQTTPISECIDSFIENRGDIKEKTEQSHRSRLNLLIEDFGDIPIGSITREMGTTLKSHIVKLPRNRKLNPLYRKYDFHELVQMNVRDIISTRTVNEHLSYLSSFMEFCKNHGYTDQNPFTGMKLPMKIRPRDERDRFSELEIKKLFNKDNYIPSTQIHKKRYEYFWVPLISLFTGMRLGEICPLYIDNVRKIKKRWCIDIVQEEERPDKSIKTLSSRRIIPIHNTLIDLGFLDYLQILKKKHPKRERIFEELRYIGGSYNKNVSKFWNVRYLPKLGLKTSKKNFHSLRHTVSDHLKQKGVEPHFVKELLGHSSGEGEWDRYGKNYEPEIMFNKCIKRIVYKTSQNSSVDFRRLKVDWKKIMN